MAAPKTLAASIKLVRSHLDKYGFLLLSDAALPSIAGLIAGAPVRGSWWGHPAGNLIFNTSVNLDDAGDVITTRLINGKVTFVGAPLWPALVAVGSERGAWQTAALTPQAKALLTALDKSKSGTTQSTGKAESEAIKQLELKLLVHAAEVHTESGAHAKVAQTWPAFVAGLPKKLAAGWEEMTPAAGRARLGVAAREFAGKQSVKLPWGAVKPA